MGPGVIRPGSAARLDKPAAAPTETQERSCLSRTHTQPPPPSARAGTPAGALADASHVRALSRPFAPKPALRETRGVRPNDCCRADAASVEREPDLFRVAHD